MQTVMEIITAASKERNIGMDYVWERRNLPLILKGLIEEGSVIDIDYKKDLWNWLADNDLGFSRKVKGKWVPLDGTETEHVIAEIIGGAFVTKDETIQTCGTGV